MSEQSIASQPSSGLIRLSSELRSTRVVREQQARVDPTIPNEPERNSTALPLDTDTANSESGRVVDHERTDLENVTITEKEYQ